MPPPAPSTPLTDTDSVVGYLSQEGVNLRLDDDQSAIVEPTELQWLGWAVNVGTTKALRYLSNRYTTANLALSWTVWNAATLFALEWLCARRANGCPLELQKKADRETRYLEMVRDHKAFIEDIPERTVDAISWANYTVDPLFRNRLVRVQQTQSEQTQHMLPVHIDYFDAIIQEP